MADWGSGCDADAATIDPADPHRAAAGSSRRPSIGGADLHAVFGLACRDMGFSGCAG